ncbi:hypothetical protein Tco_0739474 [Tanacetum coccineum]
MKDIFEELEAEVDQNIVNRKHDEIEQKNLLIANDNLIADCLPKEVFYIATNYELTVSRFTEMHEAQTIVQTHCLELEAELSKLRDKESVETLREIVEEAKVERQLDKSLASASLYTKHSQELLEYAIGTCPKDFNQRDKKHAPTPLIRKKQVTFEEQCDTSQPRSITKKNRISPAKGVNNKKVEEYPRTNMSNLRTTNRVDSSSSSKRTVIQIILWYLDSGCSKHMTGDRSWLKNFVKSVISKVYYVEGLGHNMFSVGQFCDSDMEVAFKKHSCYVRDTDGVEIIKGSRSSNLYTVSVEDMMNSSPICLLSKASKNKSWL